MLGYIQSAMPPCGLGLHTSVRRARFSGFCGGLACTRGLHGGQDQRIDDLPHEIGIDSLSANYAQQAHRNYDVGDQRPVAGGGYFAAVSGLRQNRGYQALALVEQQVTQR